MRTLHEVNAGPPLAFIDRHRDERRPMQELRAPAGAYGPAAGRRWISVVLSI